LFSGSFLSSLELVNLGFELVFLLGKFLFLLLPHVFHPLELLLLVFEDELPLQALGLVRVLDFLEGLFEQGDLLLTEMLELLAAGHELCVVGLL
jgi:hypothetical protein